MTIDQNTERGVGLNHLDLNSAQQPQINETRKPFGSLLLKTRSLNIRERFNSQTGSIALRGAVVGGLLFSAGTLALLLDKTDASANFFSNLGSLFSSGRISAQGIANPYYWTDKYSNQRREEIDNGTFGIPPNDTRRGVGTVYDYYNNESAPRNYIQPQQAKYPIVGPTQRIAVGAVGADVANDCLGMITGLGRADGFYDPYYEGIRSASNPADYSNGARFVSNAGLPQGGITGDSFQEEYMLGKDAQGNNVVVVAYKDTLVTAESGTYRAPRANNSCELTGPFVKQADPTPTTTATTTATATPTAVAKPSYKVYLPAVFNP